MRDYSNNSIIKLLQTKFHNKNINKIPIANFDIFLSHYYHSTPIEDLENNNEDDLIGAAQSHLILASKRKGAEYNLRIYNPDYEQDGWKSAHSVIELVIPLMPFIVSSISMLINKMGYIVHLCNQSNIRVTRDKNGYLTGICDDYYDNNGIKEVFVQYQIGRINDLNKLDKIKVNIINVLNNLIKACSDWVKMRAEVLRLAQLIESNGYNEEYCKFLKWIENNHFTFLGSIEFEVQNNKLQVLKNSELGVFKNSTDYYKKLLPFLGVDFNKLDLLQVNKANIKSLVHRPVAMDYISVVIKDKNNKITGIYCILGLFTSAAYSSYTIDIPFIKEKTKNLLKKSNYRRGSHGLRVFENIIHTFPRDLYFHTEENSLFQVLKSILDLQERKQVRMFYIIDDYKRFITNLVFIPREKFNSMLRMKIQDILLKFYKADDVDFDVYFSESILTRIHYTVNNPKVIPSKNKHKKLEKIVVQTARLWTDDFYDLLINQRGEEAANKAYSSYDFPENYKIDFHPSIALNDVDIIDTIPTNKIGIHFYQTYNDKTFNLKVYSPDKPITLSAVIPIIENMGLKVISEVPYTISKEGKSVWLNHFVLIEFIDSNIDVHKVKDKFEQAFLAVWYKKVENDGFNKLVLYSGLNWREVVVLRALARYLKQIKFSYSQKYIDQTLYTYPNITQKIIELFNIRFDVDYSEDRQKNENKVLDEIELLLNNVTNLDQDIIIRSIVNVVLAIVRTNFFQLIAGAYKDYLSFKIDSNKIDKMPEPRMLYEVFVYSPRVEGIHLRSGKVARGGLRWSDRMEDYRTEVLGLVKAQMVKNAVIIPMGSKGGFVAKKLPLENDKKLAEVIKSYQTFIKGLLDVTDNNKNNKIIPPKNVIRHDGDDQYLVVAADKGTASFSDIANEISLNYNFWLGDAFASGGSIGYDHKKMGITAKGTWESVKRNFRELGINTQVEDFTVVGIGDMSGDVFGNGMLLSKHIKLIAAFNHMYIFLDPNPKADVSFKERKRLFENPQKANWCDYDKSLISSGGGVFKRKDKSITISKEVAKLLAINDKSLTPNELINRMLKAEVDLLFNGGIGTYVKAKKETHIDVQDKTNDVLRVNAKELRCKVVAEGGNLGLTQLARIEYSLNGGKCYTDAIDNSAGVDTSDHEVNIKILLDKILDRGDITLRQRNSVFANMENEVEKLVLINNYQQTQAISLAEFNAYKSLYAHINVMEKLEAIGSLNRELEFLPDDETLKNREIAKTGLTKPEIAVLLSYAKLEFKKILLDTDIVNDDYIAAEILNYFPKILVDKFIDDVNNHTLKNEIIISMIVNKILNHMALGFVYKIKSLTHSSIDKIIKAWLAAVEIFDLNQMWNEIETLDNKVDAKVQIQILSIINNFLEHITLWILFYNADDINITRLIKTYKQGSNKLLNLSNLFEHTISEKLLQKKTEFIKNNIPPKMAQRLINLSPMRSSLDIINIANQTKCNIKKITTIYADLWIKLDIGYILQKLSDFDVFKLADVKAVSFLAKSISKSQKTIIIQMLENNQKNGPKNIIKQWEEENKEKIKIFTDLLNELKISNSSNFTAIMNTVNELNIFVLEAR